MAVSRTGGARLITRQRRFLASGNWTVPNGVNVVKARIVGAGASGSVVYASPFQVPGASGGAVIDVILDVTPGAVMPVTVAPVTTAPNRSFAVASSPQFVVDGFAGAASTFGGVTAPGGNAASIFGNYWSQPGQSVGRGSGAGGGLEGFTYGTSSRTKPMPGQDGIDFMGAGSGAAIIDSSFDLPARISNGGAGGVTGRAINTGAGLPDNALLSGIDAISYGAAGSPLAIANGNGGQNLTARGGYGAPGIVILEWEEVA
jgi:hypothetical protein